jgi:DNA-binding CsgD family transcriptional regulator
MNPIDKNILFGKPCVALIDNKQWMYLQKAFHLTNRELQITQLVCQGLTNNEIAESVKIKPGTVKTHLRNIYRRVRVHSKISLFLSFIAVVNRSYVPSQSASSKIPIVDIDKKGKDSSALREPSENNPM